MQHSLHSRDKSMLESTLVNKFAASQSEDTFEMIFH